MGGSDYEGDALASQSRRYRVPGQPLLGGVFRSTDGLFAQHAVEPTRGRPAVRGKGTTRVPHTKFSNPPVPISPLPHPVCPFHACSQTREQCPFNIRSGTHTCIQAVVRRCT